MLGIRKPIRCLLVLALPAAFGVAQQPATSPQWEAEIQAFEARDKQAVPKPGAVLFVGSSSIRLWENLASDFAPAYVLNRGFGGAQIADVTYYAGRIITPYRPSRVVLYVGDNDLAAGRTPNDVLADFDAFVNRVRKDLPDVPIAFVSIKPSPARENLIGRMREANANVARYAARSRAIAYIDVFTPMLGADGRPRGELFGPDGLHMNRSGYELWRHVIGSHLASRAK